MLPNTEGDYVFAMKEKVRDIWNRKRLRCWTVNPSESPACNFLRNHTKHFRPFGWTQKLSAPRSIPFLISPPHDSHQTLGNKWDCLARGSGSRGGYGRLEQVASAHLSWARSVQERIKAHFLFFFSWGRCTMSELSCHTSRKRVLITMWRALRRLQLVPGSWSESPAPFGMNILQFRLGPRALSKHS